MLANNPPTMTTPSGATGTMGADWSAVVDASKKAQEAEAGGVAKGDSKPTDTSPAAEPSATTPTPTEGAERRPDLPGDVLSVLLAATGPLAIDEIQRDVNATPGVFVPLQFVEAELDTLSGAERVTVATEGKVKQYALSAAARAEIDAPGLTIERRAAILVALARVTLGSASADFEHVDSEGAPPARLASGASLDEILGEMTEMGAAKGLTLPEAETHVDALCRAGVLVIETPLTDGTDPAAGPSEDDGDDNAFEDAADDEGEDSDGDEDAPAPVEASEPTAKVYTFAMGQLDALWTVGARGLAEKSMPTKEAPAAETSIPASALTAVEAQLKTMAIKAAEFEEQRDKYKAENALLQLRWSRAATWLDENGGGLDINVIAQEPARKADPRIFQWEKRVSITTEIKARLLDELTRLDEQLAGICSAEEVAKGSFKEKKAKVAEQIAALKMASRGVEYLYTRKAYREPDFARGVVLVRSAEEHDYGTVLDEETIPKGVQKPLFPTEPAAGPAPVKPATPGVVANAIGEAPAPSTETGTASSAPAPTTEPAAKGVTPPVEAPAPAANANANAGHIALADLALDTESVTSKIKQMHLVHPEGILERDQPVIFGQSYSPDRPMPGAVAAFVMKTIGLMLRDEEMVEADDDQGRGKLRWLATQTDPRRLTVSMKERIKAKETEKAEKASAASPSADDAPPVKRGRGRPPGAKNKAPRKDKGTKRGTKA